MRTRRLLAGSLRFSRNSLWPRMTVRRLLKSCAIPPASWPIASILLICCATRSAGEGIFSPGVATALTRRLGLGSSLPSFCFPLERRPPDNRGSADTNFLIYLNVIWPSGGKGGMEPGNRPGERARNTNLSRGCEHVNLKLMAKCPRNSTCENCSHQFADFFGVFIQCEREPREIQASQIRKLREQVQPTWLICKIHLPGLVITVTQV